MTAPVTNTVGEVEAFERDYAEFLAAVAERKSRLKRLRNEARRCPWVSDEYQDQLEQMKEEA